MYKYIKVKMRSGKTRRQRVKVLRSGKYKFVKNKGSRSKRKYPKTKRSVKYMARRKYRRKAKRSKKRGSALWSLVGGAALYGIGRGFLNKYVSPIAQKYLGPYLGAYADEAGLIGANYLLWKGKIPFLNKVPMIKSAAKIGMAIEIASTAEGFTSGLLSPSGNGAATRSVMIV